MNSLSLDKFLEKVASRRTTTGPRNRIAEIVEPYYKEMEWDNESYFQDMTVLWIAIRRFMKWRTEAQLIAVLEWGKKNQVHVRQVVKVLRKK